ncbi:unnamed protein product [Protopolystoma xenopodis]|uniref:Uncharacterized protein n=1 Tax=Protopolystoma xenopodis TaxID=117903 RepID=A0A3S5BTS2_9PLAT|nr:unnamed protein product [Protopolystoma xenopodis]
MSSSSTPHGFSHSNAIIQPHHSSHTEASVSFSSGNKHLSANPVGPAPIQPSSSASTTFSHQPANLSNMDSNQVSEYVAQLRNEVFRLRKIVDRHQEERATKLASLDREERSAVEENRRLRKALQSEIQRREALSRQLSESESSLEMEDERQFRSIYKDFHSQNSCFYSRQFNEASRHSFSGSTRVRTTSDSSSSFNLPFHPQPYPPGFFNPIGMCGPGTGCTQQTSLNPAFYGPGHAYAAAVAAAAAARSAACTGSSVPLSNEPSSSASRVCRECGQLVCLPVTSVVPIGGTSLTPNCSSGCTSTNLPIIPSSSGGISPSHPQSNVSLSSGYAAPFGHINQPQRPIASASHSPSPSPSPMSPNSTPGVCGSAFTSGCQHGSSFTSTNLAGPSSCSYSMTRHIGYPALSNYAISAGTAGAGKKRHYYYTTTGASYARAKYGFQ